MRPGELGDGRRFARVLDDDDAIDKGEAVGMSMATRLTSAASAAVRDSHL